MFSFQANANVVKETLDSTIKVTNEVLSTVDTSAVSKQLYTDVKAGLTGLATGLKVSAEHVWDILVRQQLVYSISSILIAIVLCLVSQFLIRRGWKLWQNAKEKGDKNVYGNSPSFYDGVWGLMLSFGSVIFLGGIIFFTINFTHIMTGFINPEYGAIQTIIEVVKK
jgi:hypothetical protein